MNSMPQKYGNHGFKTSELALCSLSNNFGLLPVYIDF